jgi:oligopeptide transport system ATP-binding protein
MLDATPRKLVEVRGFKMYFPIYAGLLRRHTGDVKAVDDISFDIYEGETLGLVGESGCGKSTVGRALLRLYEATAGQVVIDGETSPRLARRRCAASAPDADGVPGPAGQPQPPHDRGRHHRRAAGRTHRLTSREKLARIYELMDQPSG